MGEDKTQEVTIMKYTKEEYRKFIRDLLEYIDDISFLRKIYSIVYRKVK